MNTAQHRLVHLLLTRQQLMPQKESIVASFSNGRTTSVRQLSQGERSQLIRWLKANDDTERSAEKMRRKIMHLAHEMNITKKNALGRSVADVQRIDEWMLKYSYLKKKLNAYTLSELPKLVSQYEAVYKSFIKNF